MILSHKQLEEIAAAVTKDFNSFFFGTSTGQKKTIQATPIDQLASEYAEAGRHAGGRIQQVEKSV